MLIEASIDYHTRRRIRTWCDCSYCNAKRKGTAWISHGTKSLSNLHLIPRYLHGFYPIICQCTDGCPGSQCMARRPNPWNVHTDGDAGCRAPSDNIDDAIRNRMERVREGLRRELRFTLLNLKKGL